MAAALNWRSIRAADCEFSVTAWKSIRNDYGHEVTLGYLAAQSDAKLQRSANVGRKTLREIRAMIATVSAEHPDTPPPAIFIPHAHIDWGRLARAVAFFTAQGYQYVEMPWAVSRESVAITCPNPQFMAEVEGLGSLVGSAEQSFLHMDLAGKLGRGRFCALTPCFRLGDYEDDLHHPYFMKVELYVNNGNGLEDLVDTSVDGVEIDTNGPLLAYMHMLSIVGQFNRQELGDAMIENVRAVDTSGDAAPLACDVELNGIEIGSYGVRQHGEHTWVYGTGVAEPRFSQAMQR